MYEQAVSMAVSECIVTNYLPDLNP